MATTVGYFEELLSRIQATHNQNSLDFDAEIQALIHRRASHANNSQELRAIVLQQARTLDPSLEERLRSNTDYSLELPESLIFDGACINFSQQVQPPDEMPLWTDPTNFWSYQAQPPIRTSQVAKKNFWVFEAEILGRCGLFALRCPVDACQAIFTKKPIGPMRRGLRHLESHGLTFSGVNSEMEMIYRFARVVVSEHRDKLPPTRIWARRHNRGLLGKNEQHLLHEADNLGG